MDMSVLRRCLALAIGLLAYASGSHAFVQSRLCVRESLLRSSKTRIVSPTARRMPTFRGGAFEGTAVGAAVEGGAVDGGAVGGGLKMNIKLGLVRAAGYGIIAGSFCLKTPQIARVWSAKSVVGLAPASIYADVFLFATSVIYHVLKRNPIRAYGETVVVLIQTLVMVGLLWRYGGKDDGDVLSGEVTTTAGAAGTGTGTATAKRNKRSPGGGLLGRTAIVIGSIVSSLLCIQYLPEELWSLLVIVSTPTIVMVQLPQIWKNFRQKHTGELAGLTVLLAFLGSSIRIGTTIADLGADPWLLLNYGLGSSSNALMLFQMYIYRAKTAMVRKTVAQRTKEAPA